MITFLGNVEFEQVQQDKWTVDSFGIDSLSVAYQGAYTKKKAFEDSLVKWQAHKTYKQMRLAAWETSGGSAVFPIVVLTYTGFRSGRTPLPKGKSGQSIQSASANAINPEGRAVSGTFLYRASETQWTWFESKRPPETAPDLALLSKSNPLDIDNIIRYEISDDFDGKIKNNVPYSDFVVLFNSLVTAKVVTAYDFEMVHPAPNELWACSATYAYKIIG